MTNPLRKQINTIRHPDCVTEVRMGNIALTISGCFKCDTADTAADKMAKVLKAESRCQHPPASDPLSQYIRGKAQPNAQMR